MYIGGSLISSVEFHGNMSLVIFMSKCPLACRYCHNVELLEDNTQKTFEEVKSKIDNAADFICNKYHLSSIYIEEDDLTAENLKPLQSKVSLILRTHKVENSDISLEKIWFITKVHKYKLEKEKTKN